MAWLLIGLVVGFWARDIRDLLVAIRSTFEDVAKRHNAHRSGAVITGGRVYSGGKEQPPDDQGVVDLPVYTPSAPADGAIVRSPSPGDVAKRNEKAHKDELTRG